MTESELERFDLLPILLMSPLLMIQMVKETVSTGAKAEGKSVARLIPTIFYLFVLPLPLSTPTTYFSLNHKQQGHKQEHKVVFTRS